MALSKSGLLSGAFPVCVITYKQQCNRNVTIVHWSKQKLVVGITYQIKNKHDNDVIYKNKFTLHNKNYL